MTNALNPSNPLMGNTQSPMLTGPNMGITPGGPQSGVYSPPSNFAPPGYAHTNIEVNGGGPWGGQQSSGGTWGGNPIATPVTGAGPGTYPGPTPHPLSPGGGHWNGGPAGGFQQPGGFHPWWGGHQMGQIGHMPSWPGWQGGQASQQWGAPDMTGVQPMNNFQQPMFNMRGQGF